MKSFKLLITFAISALISSSCQSLGPSSDIVVKSDLNEKSVVKESTITKKIFDKDKAAKDQKTIVDNWNEKFSKKVCDGETYQAVKDYCFKTYKEQTVPAEQLLASINDMPELVTVRYRRLFTDVNGDRSATDYDQVACIPTGTKKEGETWVAIVSQFEPEMRTNKSSQEEALRSHVQLVADAVCLKYGGLDEKID